MLTILGAINLLLGLFIGLYTLGALLYVLPERVSLAGKIFTGLAGFGMSLSLLFSGINTVAGAFAAVEITEFSAFLALVIGIKLIPLIAVIVLLILIMTRKYHKRNGKV